MTTGFIGIRPTDLDEAMLIWAVLSSEAVRMQIYYLAVTASQPEIRKNIFEQEFLLPFPTEPTRSKILRYARSVWEYRNKIADELNSLKTMQRNLVA